MYLAIDIGGTKTFIASFTADGELRKKVRFETPKMYSEFLSSLEQNFKAEFDDEKYRFCVVGAPGHINRESGIGLEFGNLEWHAVPLGNDIKQITNTKVRIENDANLAGLSEAILLRKKYRKAVYITVSTGIGGVLIVNGSIQPDIADSEFGQMMFEHQGKLQRWEDFASGRAIYAKFGMPASDISDPAAWYVISHNIAIGLIGVVSTLTPDVVIVGGGVGSHFDKFSDKLRDHMELLGSNVVNIPPIVAAKRAEDAVLYGCYELAKQTV
jgi:predicted NBD/HSP70 family sugar kinase